MITYHPKDDVYNCIFRIISILYILNKDEIEIDRLKIIDFYLLFPHFAGDMSFPKVTGAINIKKQAKKMPPVYERLPDKKRLFSELGDIQIQALRLLNSKSIISITDQKIAKKSVNFDLNLVMPLVENNKYCNDQFYLSLTLILSEIELNGPSGLKSKSGLMEYRYDAN